MKRMTSITYSVPIICVISAIKNHERLLKCLHFPSFVLLPKLLPLRSVHIMY
jgi:hypothetical protein